MQCEAGLGKGVKTGETQGPQGQPQWISNEHGVHSSQVALDLY